MSAMKLPGLLAMVAIAAAVPASSEPLSVGPPHTPPRPVPALPIGPHKKPRKTAAETTRRIGRKAARRRF
jgi:hypothetical protein